MRSPVTTSAAVPPLARVGQKGKQKTSFLGMLGIVLGWVPLLLLLLYCEAAIVVAYGTAVERDSRNCLEMGRPRHSVAEQCKNISVISGLPHQSTLTGR